MADKNFLFQRWSIGAHPFRETFIVDYTLIDIDGKILPNECTDARHCDNAKEIMEFVSEKNPDDDNICWAILSGMKNYAKETIAQEPGCVKAGLWNQLIADAEVQLRLWVDNIDSNSPDNPTQYNFIRTFRTNIDTRSESQYCLIIDDYTRQYVVSNANEAKKVFETAHPEPLDVKFKELTKYLSNVFRKNENKKDMKEAITNFIMDIHQIEP